MFKIFSSTKGIIEATVLANKFINTNHNKLKPIQFEYLENFKEGLEEYLIIILFIEL